MTPRQRQFELVYSSIRRERFEDRFNVQGLKKVNGQTSCVGTFDEN